MKTFQMYVPNGSLEQGVWQLLADAGMPIKYLSARSYHGRINGSRLFPPPDNLVVKMRPQDITWAVADGHAHLGFAGEDLIRESGRADELQILNTYKIAKSGTGIVNLVVAVPADSDIQSPSDIRPEYVGVTEYPRITREFLAEFGLSPVVRTCHGSTEAYGPPPGNNGCKGIADFIVDNTDTGESLKAGGWRSIHTVMEAKLCLFAYKAAYNLDGFSDWSEEFMLLLNSVIAAREKVLLKFNVAEAQLQVAIQLVGDAATVSDTASHGHAIEVVVDQSDVNTLMVQLKQDVGATAIIVETFRNFVP